MQRCARRVGNHSCKCVERCSCNNALLTCFRWGCKVLSHVCRSLGILTLARRFVKVFSKVWGNMFASVSNAAPAKMLCNGVRDGIEIDFCRCLEMFEFRNTCKSNLRKYLVGVGPKSGLSTFGRPCSGSLLPLRRSASPTPPCHVNGPRHPYMYWGMRVLCIFGTKTTKTVLSTYFIYGLISP